MKFEFQTMRKECKVIIGNKCRWICSRREVGAEVGEALMITKDDISTTFVVACYRLKCLGKNRFDTVNVQQTLI